MSEATKTTGVCQICGKLTHMLGTKLCDNCWEVEHRLDDYVRSEKGRARLVKRALTGSMANAILDVENIAWNEGLGPETDARSDGWKILVNAAEEITGKQSCFHGWENRKKSRFEYKP